MAMKATRSDLGIWVAARSRSPASLSAPGRFWAVPSRCCPALFDEPPQPGTTRLTITRPCTGETRIGLRNHAGRSRLTERDPVAQAGEIGAGGGRRDPGDRGDGARGWSGPHPPRVAVAGRWLPAQRRGFPHLHVARMGVRALLRLAVSGA